MATPRKRSAPAKTAPAMSAERVRMAIQSGSLVRGLTPDRLNHALDHFAYGYLRDAALLWQKIKERDDTILAVAEKRELEASLLNWDILPLDDSPEAAKHKEALEEFYNNLTATHALDQNQRGGVAMLIKQMMHAVGHKYAVHEIVWQPDAAGLTAEFRFVPLQFFENTEGRLRFLPTEGSATWQDALANIGTSVVQEIIASFARMAAQWITQQIVMALFGRAIQAAQLAALAPMAAATAGLWAPAATAASIATFGGAAVSGAAMAKTAITTAALGFAEGGLVTGPGTGTSDSIFARLSNGEYVMPASAVQAYGVGFFEDLRAGRMPELASAPAAAGGGGGGRAVEPSVNVSQSFYFDREEAMRAALNSPAGRRLFVDLLRGAQHEV